MTLNELEDYLHEIFKITVDIHISLVNAKRLEINRYPFEDKIISHGFFQHHKYQLRFIMAVQLSKLYSKSKNQRFNLYKLLEKVENQLVETELANVFEKNSKLPLGKLFRQKDDILKAVTQLRNEIAKHDSVILKVKTLRDKVYAHKDAVGKADTYLNPSEIEPLASIAADTYNIIRGGIWNTNFDFTITHGWRIDDVIRECSYSRSHRKT